MSSPSDLAFFSVLIKFGSLSAAAREFDVTPSAASKWLNQIEQRLGVRLIHRTTRRLSLTSEGEVFLAEGRRILAEINDLEQAVSSSRSAPKGLLKVNASLGFGRSHIAPALSRFYREYPGLEVQLILTDRPMNLAEEAIDVGIRFGEPPDARVIARKLASNRRRIFASPAYLKAHGRPGTPHDLSRHNCLILRQDDSAYSLWRFSKGKQSQTIKVRGNLSSNDGEVVLNWALDGHGILMRAEWDAARFLRSGRLELLLEDYELPPADIYAIYSQKQNLAAKIRVFVEFLVKYFQAPGAKNKVATEPW
jgi:DNA-binding transcriptional LysR family regulator